MTLADGTVLRPGAVPWCTGYEPAGDWLGLPGALDPEGRPLHDGGRSPVRGLHRAGLPWQARLDSGVINGVDRNARATVLRVARHPEPRRSRAVAPTPGRALQTCSGTPAAAVHARPGPLAGGAS